MYKGLNWMELADMILLVNKSKGEDIVENKNEYIVNVLNNRESSYEGKKLTVDYCKEEDVVYINFGKRSIEMCYADFYNMFMEVEDARDGE